MNPLQRNSATRHRPPPRRPARSERRPPGDGCRRRARAHCALAGAAFVAANTAAAPAFADVAECIEAHSAGQVERDQSHLVEARRQFVSCALPSCPAAIRSACDELLADVERRLPTVVLAAQNSRGRDVLGVTVLVDGEPLEGGMSGQALEVDPGPHEFRFRDRDGREEVVRAVIREWVKGRAIEARFATPQAPPPLPTQAAPPGQPPPAVDRAEPGAESSRTLAYVLGGVGVVGLAGFGYFALAGKSERNDLARTCAPACDPERTDAISTKYLLADILLATGVASLAGGTYLYFSTPARPASGESPQAFQLGLKGRF